MESEFELTKEGALFSAGVLFAIGVSIVLDGIFNYSKWSLITHIFAGGSLATYMFYLLKKNNIQLLN